MTTMGVFRGGPRDTVDLKRDVAAVRQNALTLAPPLAGIRATVGDRVADIVPATRGTTGRACRSAGTGPLAPT